MLILHIIIVCAIQAWWFRSTSFTGKVCILITGHSIFKHKIEKISENMFQIDILMLLDLFQGEKKVEKNTILP